MSHQPADMMTPTIRRRERPKQSGDRHRHAHDRLEPAAVCRENREQRQVGRHREVFEHQHRQHSRRFPVAEPTQVLQQPRDHTRGGNVGDPGQTEDGNTVQPQKPARHRTGRGVEDDIDTRRRQVVAQTAGELGRRKLQTQGQKQQHDTDGRTGSDELTGGGHPQDAAIA
ncbi:Uncharacterised protein [Mycobacterium tuberculosis]|uniref:Uncharacterized protein n=1 Tax=Mycobacterium tuberculosis TaxID=1773 RepID=A0A0U0R7N9_MYCTX|nr:Uncharacterised protein [Mycobacterium tuberculosis]CNM29539.1 Uncharacterised protein [Mycobacterium tuberculosis]COV34814.1 Uncharacterised protein [Mycobacterium tuberculosis]COV79710.1 Uncharacterised protein [Mycobacterium tuberculosis]COW23041.1 Uncharacterised protein [Mycobacterium tuberculosis]